MTPTGKFFASVNYRTEFFAPPVDLTNPKTIGLDMKMDGGFAESQGKIVPFPRWMRNSLDKLAEEQRKLSKKVKGSRNWHKQRMKVAKYHEKVVNQRRDFLHKLTRQLVDEYQVIGVEDLNLQGMAKGHFGKSVSDNAWATFVRFLEYKALWYGATIYKVDRFFPSSKTCNECGHAVKLTLADREWTCPSCGSHHDRDVNAARNIEMEALRFLGISRGGARPSLEESSKTRTPVLASA
jgi:putative transposase